MVDNDSIFFEVKKHKPNKQQREAMQAYEDALKKSFEEFIWGLRYLTLSMIMSLVSLGLILFVSSDYWILGMMSVIPILISKRFEKRAIKIERTAYRKLKEVL